MGSTRLGSTVRPPTTTQESLFEETRERFIEEGRTLAQFDHPGIVRVLDAFGANNTTYLVMELLIGESVESLVSQNGCLSEDKVRELIVSVCGSLKCVHEAGVLHRDVKPANIIWHPARGPVLIDFGSARHLIVEHVKTATALVSHGFAPVEQYQSKGVFGPPTDIYALAATAFCALTGAPPPSVIDRGYGGDSLGGVVTRDLLLGRCIAAGLALSARDRPQSTSEFVGLLRSMPSGRAVVPSELEAESSKVALPAAVPSEVAPLKVTPSGFVGSPTAVVPVDVVSSEAAHSEAAPSEAAPSEAVPSEPVPSQFKGSPTTVVPSVGWGNSDSVEVVSRRKSGKGRLVSAGIVGCTVLALLGFSAFKFLSGRGNVRVLKDAAIQELCCQSGTLSSVAWSPDGNSLVSGGGNGSVWLWDVAPRKASETLSGHTSDVSSVAWSPDGTTVVSGSFDDTVRLWDVVTGKAIHTLSGHTKDVWSVAWSPDGTMVASGSLDDTVRLWDVVSGETRRILPAKTGGVFSVAWSPDSKTIVTGGGDGTVRLWDAGSGQNIQAFASEAGGVLSVAWSPDGKTVASTGWNTRIDLWDPATGKGTKSSSGHTGGVLSVSWSPDGETLATGGVDSAVRLRDVASGAASATKPGHFGGVSSVSWSPDGTKLASAGGSGKVIVAKVGK